MMLYKTITLCLALFIFAATVSGQRPRNRQKRPRPEGKERPAADKYEWSRDVAGVNVEEFAIVPIDKNIVIVVSKDDALRDVNITKTYTVYDFNSTEPVVAMKRASRRGSPCFMISTSLTYTEVISELQTRNGSTTVATSLVLNMDGTGEPLNKTEVKDLFTENPSIRKFCRGSRIIVPTPVGAPASDTETRDVIMLSLDEEVNMVIPAAPPRRRGPGRRPGGSRGRPGGSGGRPGGSGGRPGGSGGRPGGSGGRPGGSGGRPGGSGGRPGGSGGRPGGSGGRPGGSGGRPGGGRPSGGGGGRRRG